MNSTSVCVKKDKKLQWKQEHQTITWERGSIMPCYHCAGCWWWCNGFLGTLFFSPIFSIYFQI